MAHQSTFDDIRRSQSLDELTAKQVSIVRLLSTGATQGMIHRQLRLSRASISQTCKILEQNGLIKKAIGERYNILYELSPQLHKRIAGNTERLTACRVHNIALKFTILNQDRQICKDKRAGFTGSWFMRGKVEWYKFWFPGKAGEISCTVTVYPRSIKVQMDAGQKIIGKNVADAEQRGFQHLIHIRQKFIESQRLFGVNFDIEPTGTKIFKTHGGFAGSISNPVMQEGVTMPGWWIDKSGKGELGEDKLELESHLERGGPTRLDKLIQASEQFDHLPDLIKSSIDPLSKNIQRVEALIQGERTDGQKVIALMDVVGHLLDRMMKLEERLELKSQP